jgi:aldehyde dehydrogenase (NAD+)
MDNMVAEHRTFARSQRNQSVGFRAGQLEKLRRGLIEHRVPILQALDADLRKPEIEAYASEFSPVIHEIAYAKRHLRQWMRPRRPGRNRRVLPSPHGAALVIGTWNYPVQLTLSPVVAAIAAGNGVTIKPSEFAPETAAAIKDLVDSVFSPEEVTVVPGGPEETASLIDLGYDKVFFTGSPRVGAIVAERAARHHSNVTLELGGKSPAIVGPGSDLAYAAKRIVWGKFINAGQTCMAPDYLLVPEQDADTIEAELAAAIHEFYGDDPAQSPDLARIINDRHFIRIAELAKSADLDVPQDREQKYIAPTVVRSTLDSPLMAEEIFGPILPILTYRTLEDIRGVVARNPNPLAVYVFTRDRSFERRALTELDFGGAMVNDVILHSVDPRIPFGGRGSSGSGSYHGRFGFDAFTHYKGVARKRQGRPKSLRFPPYRPLPEFLRKLLFGL